MQFCNYSFLNPSRSLFTLPDQLNFVERFNKVGFGRSHRAPLVRSKICVKLRNLRVYVVVRIQKPRTANYELLLHTLHPYPTGFP